MNRIQSFFKEFHLRQVFAVLLAGFLFLTTACAARSDVQARVPGTTLPATSGQAQGGMNEYSDIDPRRNTTGAEAHAKALQDRVEKNINTKRIDSVDQYVDNYTSGAPIQDRTDRALRGIGESVEDLKEDAQELGQEVSNKTQRTTQNVRDNAQNAAQNVRDNTRDAARDAVRDTRQATDRTANFVQDKADKAARGTRRALDDAADAMDDRA